MLRLHFQYLSLEMEELSSTHGILSQRIQEKVLGKNKKRKKKKGKKFLCIF